VNIQNDQNTFGDQWKRVLGDRALEPAIAEAARREQECTQILAALPDKIRKAIDKGLPNEKVYKWMTPSDVHGGDVDEFWIQFGQQPLSPDDVSGIAKEVVTWCHAHGLRVFMAPQRIHLNDREFILLAAPL